MAEGGGARLRAGLVADLEGKGSLKTDAVRGAFLAVPRELFVPEVAAEKGMEAVYRDEVFVTKTDGVGNPTSSSSMPGIMATMLEQLDLRPGHRVLEIGAGTGYNAGLMKSIVGPRGRVVSVELDPDLARRARTALRAGGYRVRVITGDGIDGWGPGAPYDRIIATTSSAVIPTSWISQLTDAGLVELPWRLSDRVFMPQVAMVFRRSGPRLESVAASPAGFMAMRLQPDDPAPLDPEIRITERIDGAERVIGRVSGQMLHRLSRGGRTRMMALLAEPARTSSLGFRADWFPLMCWIALAGGSRCVVANGFGLADPKASGVAVVRGTPRWATRIHAWGSSGPERRLAALADRYRAADKPPLDALRVVVGPQPKGSGWFSLRRGGAPVFVRWDTNAKPALHGTCTWPR